MKHVSIHEAKTHLSKLLVQVSLGEEIIISKSGKPVAKLIPLHEIKTKRKPGLDVGKGHISDDFDEPLPEKMIKSFYK